MWDNLKRDTAYLREIKKRPFPLYLMESLLFENGYQAVVLYRVSHWFKSRGVPFFGPLFHRLSIFLTGVDIDPSSEIGPGLRIGHGVGLVVGGQSRIGADAVLLQGVTIGGTNPRHRDEMPVLGDRVFVGAGACIIGNLRIGDDVFIGVNAVVARDVTDGCKVVSSATIKILEPEAPPAADPS